MRIWRCFGGMPSGSLESPPVTLADHLRRTNKTMIAFDLALGSGAILAPAATLRLLGHEAPSSRQLLLLRLMGLVVPPQGASILLRARGILILILLVVGILALGLGIVELIALPFGGIDVGQGLVLGALLAAAALGILAFFGRRRQKKAQAARQAPG